MEELVIDIKELEEFNIEDEREVVIQEVAVYPELENLTITPTSEEQVFNHEDSYGYDEIRVKGVKSEKLDITPTKEEQNYSGFYNEVNVGAVTNEIDENIVADNIKNGVEILGVQGNFVGSKYAPKFISFYQYDGNDLDYELSNLDTSNLTTMKNMFYNCHGLTSMNMSNFDTSNVTNMYRTFYNCYALTFIDVSNWDTSSVTDMHELFSNCDKLESIDVSNWDTSSVTDMYRMFYYNRALSSIDVSNFDTSSVTDMSYMFCDCRTLTSIDVSNFDTSNVTNMNYMFHRCSKLTSLDIRNFTFDNVTSYANMFTSVPADCEIIVKGDTEKEWVLARRSDLTNVKTVAEL